MSESRFNAEEIRGWVRGQAKLTTEDLARYWKDEYFNAVSQVRDYEDLMLQYSDEARLRLVALDPDALPAPRDDAADGWV